jgi:hypothetical protein
LAIQQLAGAFSVTRKKKPLIAMEKTGQQSAK